MSSYVAGDAFPSCQPPRIVEGQGQGQGQGQERIIYIVYHNSFWPQMSQSRNPASQLSTNPDSVTDSDTSKLIRAEIRSIRL